MGIHRVQTRELGSRAGEVVLPGLLYLLCLTEGVIPISDTDLRRTLTLRRNYFPPGPCFMII